MAIRVPSLPPRLSGLPAAAIHQIIAAGEALDAGRVDQASNHLANVWAAHSGHPEVLRMQAGILGLRGEHGRAIETMRQAIASRPGDPVYLNTLGSMLGPIGEFDAAIDILRAACRLQPNFALAWFNLGLMLTRCVRHAEAIEAFQHAVQADPDDAHARCLLADQLRIAGDTTAARADYRNVLARKPWAGMAWWGLADLRTNAFTAEDTQQMRAAWVDDRASIDERIATGFALAHQFDQLGDYHRALTSLQQAHALARQRQTWNRHAFSARVDTVLAAPVAAQPDSASLRGAEVIFVVGMPRSGTTLIEQMLASHPRVQGSGELPDLPIVLNTESHRRRQPFPLWTAMANADDWQRLGEQYLARTAYWRRQKPRFVDKLPFNWFHIGAIRAMLPAAHIVVCRRDPLETCFSCYRQLMQNNEYTRTFTDLAAYWHDFDRAARHWLASCPTHVHELVHENLLANPEQDLRHLLQACDLEFDTACLAFHSNCREVNSPSASQVRQPLRRDTRHTPNYGALLDPLRQALAQPPERASQ